MADRVLVIHEGRLVAEIARADADEALDHARRHRPVARPARVTTTAASHWRAHLAGRSRRLPSCCCGPASSASCSPSLIVFVADHDQEPRTSPTRRSIQQLLAGRLADRPARRRRDDGHRHPQRRPVGRVGARAVRLRGRRCSSATIPARRSWSRSPLGIVIGAVDRRDQRIHHHGVPGPEPGGHAGDALHRPRCRRPSSSTASRSTPTAIPRAFQRDRLRGHRWACPVAGGHRRSSWCVVAGYAHALVPVRAATSTPSAPTRSAAGWPVCPAGRRVFTAFVISGALAGLAGALFLAQFATVDATGGTGYELNVIAAVVVGGVAIFGGSGTVVGAALGALLLNTINQALVAAKVSAFWNQAVAGALLLLAIAFDRYARPARRQRAASGGDHRDGERPADARLRPPDARRRGPACAGRRCWSSLLVAALSFGAGTPQLLHQHQRCSTSASTSARSRSWRCR